MQGCLCRAQWQKVRLPSNLTCEDCTIRLLRQVPAFDPNFVFWSCGDVNIVPRESYVETCSNRGTLHSDGKCHCLSSKNMNACDNGKKGSENYTELYYEAFC